MTTEQTELFHTLYSSRQALAEALDKAWEVGYHTIGEEEFENYDWVKNSRESLELLNIQINNLLNT